MSAKLNRPGTQARLTNVAIVRLKRAGKRFEIACYKNKVVNWRNGVEKDIDEVLQTETVFQNVSKGVIAKAGDLKKAFGTTEHNQCSAIILDKGQLQVSDRERQVQYESLFKDVATIVAAKCVNPSSKRPYSVSMIQRAMKDIHFAVKTSKGAKQQALEVISLLKKTIAIERAQMRLLLTVPAAGAKRLQARVAEFKGEVTNETWEGDSFKVEVLVDPGVFRGVDEAVSAIGKGKGSLEVVDTHVRAQGDAMLEDEIEEAPPPPATSVSAGGAGGGAGAGVGAGGGTGAGGDGGADSSSGGSQRKGKRGKKGGKKGGKKCIKCSTCRAEFTDPNDHRAHCKSDWHRFNLKRKLKSLEPITQETFDATDETQREEFFAEL